MEKVIYTIGGTHLHKMTLISLLTFGTALLQGKEDYNLNQTSSGFVCFSEKLRYINSRFHCKEIYFAVTLYKPPNTCSITINKSKMRVLKCS